jgi:hypothetical protein
MRFRFRISKNHVHSVFKYGLIRAASGFVADLFHIGRSEVTGFRLAAEPQTDFANNGYPYM